ncbi:MAG: hypothetical protein ACXVQX_10965, partial [Actinomycetota bacterium]
AGSVNRIAMAFAGIAEWVFDRIAPIKAPYDDPTMEAFGPRGVPPRPSPIRRVLRPIRARRAG